MDVEILMDRIRFDINHSFLMVDAWFNEEEILLNYKPSTGGWTGIQILEHIMLTNHYLLLLIEKGTAKALKRTQTKGIEFDVDSLVDRNKLAEVGRHKSFRWIRPEHMEPQSKLKPSEIRKLLKDQEINCLDCLNKLKNGEGFLSTTTMSVNSLGKLNMYEYVEFLTLHMTRHITQLDNNKREYFDKLI